MKKILWSNYNCEEDCYNSIENGYYLDELRDNLDIELHSNIFVFARLDLWNGSCDCVREITGKNIKDCFWLEDDYCTYYINETNDLICDGVHHDGTNTYLYRIFKKDVTKKDREKFIYKFCNKGCDYTDFENVTEPIGKEICKVFGWDEN